MAWLISCWKAKQSALLSPLSMTSMLTTTSLLPLPVSLLSCYLGLEHMALICLRISPFLLFLHRVLFSTGYVALDPSLWLDATCTGRPPVPVFTTLCCFPAEDLTKSKTVSLFTWLTLPSDGKLPEVRYLVVCSPLYIQCRAQYGSTNTNQRK